MVKDRSKCDIVMTGLYQHFLWAKSPCSSLMLFDSFVILPNSHQKTGDINPRGGCLTRRRRRSPRRAKAGGRRGWVENPSVDGKRSGWLKKHLWFTTLVWLEWLMKDDEAWWSMMLPPEMWDWFLIQLTGRRWVPSASGSSSLERVAASLGVAPWRQPFSVASSGACGQSNLKHLRPHEYRI